MSNIEASEGIAHGLELFRLPVIHAGIDVYKATQRNIDTAINKPLLSEAATMGKCARGCAHSGIHAAVFRVVVLVDEWGNEIPYRKCMTCDNLERLYYPR